MELVFVCMCYVLSGYICSESYVRTLIATFLYIEWIILQKPTKNCTTSNLTIHLNYKPQPSHPTKILQLDFSCWCICFRRYIYIAIQFLYELCFCFKTIFVIIIGCEVPLLCIFRQKVQFFSFLRCKKIYLRRVVVSSFP